MSEYGTNATTATILGQGTAGSTSTIVINVILGIALLAAARALWVYGPRAGWLDSFLRYGGAMALTAAAGVQLVSFALNLGAALHTWGVPS